MLAFAWAWHPAPARADGDPASDVLATQALFLPQDAGATPAQRAQLSALLQTAARRGYPIRVALVASASDLGSVTALWRQPATYARFLGQELAFVHKGPLLVVMPNGVGLTRLGRPLPGQAALTGLGAPGTGAGLAGAAITAVRRLAAAAGHPLPASSVQAPRTSGSSDTIACIVLAAGALAIAIAWGLSLRARPLRLGRRSAETAP
ncbi:MAG TPA: hypothetical protein VFI54_13085 [Solirubrobacteraceae bacterium]|nr:hypothetical protein [Solirubrobacteraceae bacterium]